MTDSAAPKLVVRTEDIPGLITISQYLIELRAQALDEDRYSTDYFKALEYITRDLIEAGDAWERVSAHG